MTKLRRLGGGLIAAGLLVTNLVLVPSAFANDDPVAIQEPVAEGSEPVSTDEVMPAEPVTAPDTATTPDPATEEPVEAPAEGSAPVTAPEDERAPDPGTDEGSVEPAHTRATSPRTQAATNLEEESEDGFIVVVKEVHNEPFPNIPEDFSFTGDAGSFSLNGGESHGPVAVPAGFHDVTETHPLPPGWTLTSAFCIGDQDEEGIEALVDGPTTAYFEVSPGETVTCTFTDVFEGDVPDGGRIQVGVTTEPLGSQQTFDFEGVISPTLGSGGFSSFVDVPAGSHQVTQALSPEQVDEGWSLEEISCAEDGSALTVSTVNVAAGSATMNVEAGETITCVFHNVLDRVLGERIDQPEEPHTAPQPEARSGLLPFTGSTQMTRLVLVAIALMLGGAAMLLAGRKLAGSRRS